MPRFSRSVVVAVSVFAVAVAWWSCASAGGRSLPAPPNSDALRDSILSSLPPASDFLPLEGDEQYVHASLFGKTYGIIEPYKNAHLKGLEHRKILARIWVDHDYRSLVAKKWNYWVVGDGATIGGGKWVALFVSAGDPLRVRVLTTINPGHVHTHARARWQNHSDAAPWATCSPSMCCCEGSSCNDLRALTLD